jgi:hypothetical protein
MAEEDKTGCFAWCVGAKQACNKRVSDTLRFITKYFRKEMYLHMNI